MFAKTFLGIACKIIIWRNLSQSCLFTFSPKTCKAKVGITVVYVQGLTTKVYSQAFTDSRLGAFMFGFYLHLKLLKYFPPFNFEEDKNAAKKL